MDKHLTVLGILYIVVHALGLIAAGVVLITLGAGGILSGDRTTLSAALAIAVLVSSLLILASAPGIVAGIGLLNRAPWSRILALIVAALHLVNIPFGTIFGAYAIWVLVQDDSIRILARKPAVVAHA